MAWRLLLPGTSISVKLYTVIKIARCCAGNDVGKFLIPCCSNRSRIVAKVRCKQGKLRVSAHRDNSNWNRNKIVIRPPTFNGNFRKTNCENTVFVSSVHQHDVCKNTRKNYKEIDEAQSALYLFVISLSYKINYPQSFCRNFKRT